MRASSFLFASGLLLGLTAAAEAAPAETPWKRHVIRTGLRGSDGVRFADADGDGLPDVVTGWEQSGVTSLSFNPGKEKVREPWTTITLPGVRGVEDAVLVDLDGDGATDVVSSCEGGGRSVFVHWGPKSKADYRDPTKWKTEPIPGTKGRLWMFAVPLQVDGKHGLDLVIGGKTTDACVAWLEAPANPRDLSAWKLHTMCKAGWIMSIVAKDMDGDGDSDVLISDRKGDHRGVRWLENPGHGPAQELPWKNHDVGAMKQQVMFLDTGDLDGDGLEDIVVNVSGSTGKFLRRQDASGTRWQSHAILEPTNVGSGKAYSLGDIDLDGKLDIVLTCEHAAKKSGVVWLKPIDGPTSDKWQRNEISGPAGVKFDIAALIDLDGDGDLDVVTTEEVENLGIIWYENPTR